MPVRRLDRLGPAGDTLFCLVHGDAYRVDVHEAPELLHYGIDSYTAPAAQGEAPAAIKNLRVFTRQQDGTITFVNTGQNSTDEGVVQVPIGASFRTASPRVLRLADLAAALGAANGAGTIDSAEMGFAMTEGVGMVSFFNRDAPSPSGALMKAIVPLNVAALRVSNPDATNVTPVPSSRAGPPRSTCCRAARRPLRPAPGTRSGFRWPRAARRPRWRPASTCTGNCPTTSSAAARTRTPTRSCSRTRRPAGSSSAR